MLKHCRMLARYSLVQSLFIYLSILPAFNSHGYARELAYSTLPRLDTLMTIMSMTLRSLMCAFSSNFFLSCLRHPSIFTGIS